MDVLAQETQQNQLVLKSTRTPRITKKRLEEQRRDVEMLMALYDYVYLTNKGLLDVCRVRHGHWSTPYGLKAFYARKGKLARYGRIETIQFGGEQVLKLGKEAWRTLTSAGIEREDVVRHTGGRITRDKLEHELMISRVHAIIESSITITSWNQYVTHRDLIPDAAADVKTSTGRGRVLLIEVDRGGESLAVIQEKAKRYNRYHEELCDTYSVNAVHKLFVTLGAQRAANMAEAVRGVCGRDDFKFYHFAHLEAFADNPHPYMFPELVQ